MAKKTIRDYYETVDTFTKDLPAYIQRSSVQAVSDALKVIEECAKGKRGEYQYIISPEDKAEIWQYTAKNGVSAALCHFKSTGAFPYLKESTIHGWRNAYCSELSSRSRERDASSESIKELPGKCRGRPLLLGKGNGGAGQIVSEAYQSIRKGCELANCHRDDQRCSAKDANLLTGNGGPMLITKDWGK